MPGYNLKGHSPFTLNMKAFGQNDPLPQCRKAISQSDPDPSGFTSQTTIQPKFSSQTDGIILPLLAIDPSLYMSKSTAKTKIPVAKVYESCSS